MKKYEEKTIKSTSKILVEISCDLCDKKTNTTNWDKGYYQVADTKIKTIVKYDEGHDSYDGGEGVLYEIDICPDCFKNKLIPWLKSEGAVIQEKEWEW